MAIRQNPRFSILISSRSNSKYLSKFLTSMMIRSNRKRLNCEFLVMTSQHDTWNKDFIEFFEAYTATIEKIVGFAPPLKFYAEDKRLGRDGLHVYFNELAKEAKGEWLIYFCDDHYIKMENWDEELIHIIEQRDLNSEQIHVIVPKFDNAGAMNHMVSRGYYEVLGHLGQNGWIDSYINDVSRDLPTDRVHKIDLEPFHDFTHDKPEPMDPITTKSPIDDQAVKLIPKKGTHEYDELVKKDRDLLNHQIQRGRR